MSLSQFPVVAHNNKAIDAEADVAAKLVHVVARMTGFSFFAFMLLHDFNQTSYSSFSDAHFLKLWRHGCRTDLVGLLV